MSKKLLLAASAAVLLNVYPALAASDTDLEAIKDATKNNEVTVLELLPLQKDEVHKIIYHAAPNIDAAEF